MVSITEYIIHGNEWFVRNIDEVEEGMGEEEDGVKVR